MIRVLVTGSREWPQPSTVYTALWAAQAADRNMVVIHGGHRKGADLFAAVWAEQSRCPQERFPVTPHEWKTPGKAAGPIRNHRMLDTRPDLVLAFIHDGSRGATGCLEEAKRRGIPWACYRTADSMPHWIGYEDSDTARMFNLSAALDQWRRDHEAGRERSGPTLHRLPSTGSGL
jgi:hypothetical protein